MTRPVVFMFPGQGAQYYQMARELYDTHPRFKLWMQFCDEIARPLLDASLVDAIYQGEKSKEFDRITLSNPALLAVEFSLAKIIMEMGIQPNFLVGYSLGEFTSAVVSGVISIEQGLELVVGMARILEEKSPPASMLAIVAPESILAEYSELFQNSWVTGRNFQNNFVISGLLQDIQRIQNGLIARAIPCQKLPVNYGFHTEIMNPLGQDFKGMVQQHYFSDIRIPIISGLTTKQLNCIDADHFWKLIRYPVEFSKTITNMMKNGDYQFIDVGPSGGLATAVKYLLPEGTNSQSIEIVNRFGNDLQSVGKFKSIFLEEAMG